jgi:hypothetical protein
MQAAAARRQGDARRARLDRVALDARISRTRTQTHARRSPYFSRRQKRTRAQFARENTKASRKNFTSRHRAHKTKSLADQADAQKISPIARARLHKKSRQKQESETEKIGVSSARNTDQK